MLKTFTVVFIPNCYQHKDDPSDYKEWEEVQAKNSADACAQFRDHAIIVRCYES